MKYLSTIIFSILVLSACTLLGNGASIEHEIEFGKIDFVKFQIVMQRGFLNLRGSNVNDLKAQIESMTKDNLPSISYETNENHGQLNLIQDGNIGLLGVDQWNLEISNQVPVDLNIYTGSGVSNLFLSSFHVDKFIITTDQTLLTVNLTGFWESSVQGVISANGGHVSLLLPAGVPAQITITGEPENLDVGDMQFWDGVYINQAAINKKPLMLISIEAAGSQFNFNVGYPGDKTVNDVLTTAQMIFAKNEVYKCEKFIDDGQEESDRVADLWYDYLCEYGPEHRVFAAQDELTEELAKSLVIQEIRKKFYVEEKTKTEGQLIFGADAFMGASADLMVKMQGIDDPDFSITHFLGSFNYSIEPLGGRLFFKVHNQTDRASGTRVPFRYIEDGFETSLEELDKKYDGFGDAFLMEILMSERYPILSILEAKSRQETINGEGGGIFTQSFTWSERLLSEEEFFDLHIPEDFSKLDIQ